MPANPKTLKRPARTYLYRTVARLLTVPACLLTALAAPLAFSTASATDTQTVYTPSGKPLFAVTFLEKGQYISVADPQEDSPSLWNMNAQQKNATLSALSLWAETLGPGSANTTPLQIEVATNNDFNASGGDIISGGMTGTEALLTQNRPQSLPAYFIIGQMDFSYASHFSPIPETGGTDYIGVVYHEMAHPLGILSGVRQGTDGTWTSAFTQWNSHLYDRNGTRLQQGMTIGHDATADFVVGYGIQSGVTFRGTHVSQVLDATMNPGNPLQNGLPIEGFEGDGTDDYLDLMHIELEHSLMSHQYWRNYTTFMEAELAALQDIGYTIDRKNFFGFSVYGDGLTLTNTQGYFARNATGTGWLEGQENTATLGVGLHIYGKNNTITQAADILAGGTAGTGIRIDGLGNTLTIAPDVTVAANGEYGTGLLVAYGKNQHIASRGTLTATGTGGIAARFDFGDNLLGNDIEYRGSWMANSFGSDMAVDGDDLNGLPLNLDGAMVTSFDVTGALAGQTAAIYIAENALVKNIHIMNGATLSGDIVSEWDADNPLIQSSMAAAAGDDLTTTLSFGMKADDDGNATTDGDPDFSLAYTGNITGPKSLHMTLDGGHLTFNGTADILDVTLAENTTLDGNALYRLNTVTSATTGDTGGTFTNRGTLATSARTGHIAIDGNYTQTASGTLATGFYGDGTTDTLAVTGNATLDGTLALAPQPSYYTGTVTPDTAATSVITGATTLTGAFSGTRIDLSHFASPTLELNLANGGSAVTATRSATAYSRYATGDDRSLARILDANADHAQGDAQALYAAMDFSAADGSALRQGYASLSPAAYGQSALASLALERHLSQAVLNRPILPSGPENREGRHLYAIPLAGHMDAHDGGDGYRSNYAGMIAGADITRDGITGGGYLAALHQSMRDKNHSRMQGEGIWAGLHGKAAPASWQGWQLTGLAQLGIFNADMNRTATIGDYTRRTESDWTQLSGSAVAHIGHAFTPADGLTLMPYLGADYAFLHTPSIRESKGGAARLSIDSENWQSLQAVLGISAETAGYPAARAGYTLKGHASLAFRHELLNDPGDATAHFTDLQGDFTRDIRFATRNSFTASAGVSYTAPDGTALDLSLATDLAPGHGTSIGGYARIQHPF